LKSFLAQIINNNSILAIWGAGLSSILAFVKFWEIWKTRARIEVSHSFTTNQEFGNNVIIRNLSATPINITYWELLWCRSRFFCRKSQVEISSDELSEDTKLPGYSSRKLNFSGADHFNWTPAFLGKNKIYLRLYIAGKLRPVFKKVYG
jgi:hypothetical protein